MRERGMGFIGAIIAMVIAGLIVAAIVYWGPGIWRGSSQETGKVGDIRQIVENPTMYLNQKVTIDGKLDYAKNENWMEVYPYPNYIVQIYEVINGTWYTAYVVFPSWVSYNGSLTYEIEGIVKLANGNKIVLENARIIRFLGSA